MAGEGVLGTVEQKLIVRIGGTSFSGSTMLDLMLSNREEGFSCGEINALFRPYRIHHYRPRCGCGDPNCSVWDTVKKTGERNLWKTLPELFPANRVFVDSSKELVWLRDQGARLLPEGFSATNILIWKMPIEFALSCWKRGQLDNWYGAYKSYFTRYFSIVPRWYSVRYSALVQDPASKLQALCQKLGISYFPDMEHYWSKTHHTLFGSDSAKLHLYDRQDKSYNDIAESRSAHKSEVAVAVAEEIRFHKQIYRADESQYEALPKDVRDIALNDPALRRIVALLEATEVSTDLDSGKVKEILSKSGLRPTPGWYIASRAKRLVRAAACRFSGAG